MDDKKTKGLLLTISGALVIGAGAVCYQTVKLIRGLKELEKKLKEKNYSKK